MSESEGGVAVENSDSERLNTVVAILIALVTVLGAIIAWRASVYDDGAGDADFAGLHAAANYQEAKALSRVNAYEHYGVFISYYRNRQVAEGLQELAEQAKGERAEELKQQAREAAELANASLTLLAQNDAARYLNRNDTYALDREMGAMMAAAAKQKDLNYQVQFDEAETLRNKTARMFGTIVILGISLVFFTLVETFEGGSRYVMVGLGVILAIWGAVWWILIEVKG